MEDASLVRLAKAAVRNASKFHFSLRLEAKIPKAKNPGLAAGVPALRVEGRNLALALKSGNFGGPDFFAEAMAIMERPA